jgi:hypothetical protein
MNEYTELFSYKDNRFVLARRGHVTGTSAIVLYYLLWELSHPGEVKAAGVKPRERAVLLQKG